MAIIEMEGITKSFRAGEQEMKILKGVDLQIREGEFVSIMGPSGSGKTTLSSILGCLASATSGTFRLNGEDVSRYTQDQMADVRGRTIGYIFQDFNLLDGVSAVDNVAMPLVYAGVPPRQRRERAAHLLEQMGLGHRLNHLPNMLSGGQKQRVAIARALANDPKLIFADEATGALDAKTSFEIMSLLQRLSMAGRTIVQVTHSDAHARFSKRILHIMDGMIVKDEFVEAFTVGILESDRSTAEGSVNRMWQIIQHTKKSPVVDHVAELRLLLDQSSSIDTLIEASKALLGYNDSSLNRQVMRLFKHEHWAVRAEIVKNCNATSQDFALGFFVAGLADENAWVRFLAISRLSKLEPNLLFVGEDPIRNCLSDPDERVRAAAVALVGYWKAREFIPRLLELSATDPIPRVRANAVESLGIYLDDPEYRGPAAEALEARLDDKHHRVRSTAAVTLRRVNPESCFRAASSMLNSSTSLMRAAGAWALGNFEDLPSSLLLIELANSEKDEMVSKQLVRSLGRCARKALPTAVQIRMILDEAQDETEVSADIASPLDAIPKSA